MLDFEQPNLKADSNGTEAIGCFPEGVDIPPGGNRATEYR
jgi:hypothetical protein